MSHVAAIDLKISDLDALSGACEALGLEFKPNQKTYKWFGRWVGDYRGGNAAVDNGIDPNQFGKSEHAIEVKGNPNAYGIGLVPARDGSPTFELVYDNWSGGYGLEEKAGKDLNRLRQEYAAQVSMRQLARQGYQVSRTQTSAGEVQVLAFKR